MEKITVLVAVYNAERTLKRALDSLLAQTYAGWEAVCIDDASTDASLKKLHEYAALDSRFRVLHLPENGGQAHARNEGLRLSDGTIVTFLDSDDWLSADALQRLAETFEEHGQTDAVLFSVVNVVEGCEEPYLMPTFERLSGKDAFLMSLDWTIHGVYAARRSLFDRFAYDDSCRAYSDDLTTHLHYYFSREVRTCTGIYYYWQNPQSVTHKPTVRRFDILRARERMHGQLLALGVEQEVIDRYETLRWLTLVDCCMFWHVHGRGLTASERREGIAAMRHAWQTIEKRAISRKISRKFGYRPLPWWWLFRCQEWLYFSLRALVGKNK